MSDRQNYTMTQADYDGLIERISLARQTSGMWLSGGVPMGNVQETANGAWCELGRRMGFNGMTVRPGASELQFSAIPTPELSDRPYAPRCRRGEDCVCGGDNAAIRAACPNSWPRG